MTDLFLTTLRLSLHGGLIALAVILLRMLLKKAPKWTHVALWSLVALRLILPFTVEFRLSAVPEVIGSGQVLEEWSEHTVGKTEVIYEGKPEYLQARKAGIPTRQDGAGKRYVLVGEDPESPPKTVEKDLLPVLLWLWLAGMSVMLVYMAFSYGRLHRLTLGAFRERENIYRSERILSPFLLGVVRPRICLPLGLEEPELTYVLAHEQAHIARKDHWWKALGFWILCIHWFNPALWVAYVLFCKDIEFACDAYVAKSLPQGRLADYSQALLNCSLHEKKSLPCPLSFAETGVGERVKKILDYRKPGIWICLAAAVAACLCAVFLMTGSGRPPVTEQPPVTEAHGEQTVPNMDNEGAIWLRNPKYPSRDTFFEKNRPLRAKENSNSWQAVVNGEKVTFTLIHDPHSLNPNWLGGTLSVRGSDGSKFPMVAVSTRLENAMLFGCDGRYAYFCEFWSGTFGERVVRLDLKTQLWETVVEGEILRQIVIPEDGLMYYLNCSKNDAQLCRMYIPEKSVEVLAEITDTVVGSLRLYPPTTILGKPDILWEGEERVPEPPADLKASAGDLERPWLTEPKHPNSGEYLYGDERALKHKENNCGWTIQRQGKTVTYTLTYEETEMNTAENPDVNADSVCIRDSDGNVYNNVYASAQLVYSELLACDGRYLYYCSYDWDAAFASRIIRVDLAAGTEEVLVEADKVWDIFVFEDLLMYYLTEEEDDMSNISVNRMFLPTGETRVYHNFFEDPWRVTLVPPTTLWGTPECLVDPKPVLVPFEREQSPDWTQDPQRPWLADPVYPEHYVDYYKYNRAFDTGMDPVSWQFSEEISYTLVHEGAPENPGNSISVQASNGAIYEKVFVSDALIGGKLLCCDGRYAWFCEDWDGNISYRRISRVDLKTGEREVITETEKIWDIYVMEGMVIYYMTFNGEEVRVCNMYLPEAEERGRYAMFLPERLDTENGSVPVIPEMVELTPPEKRNGNPTWELTARRAQ